MSLLVVVRYVEEGAGLLGWGRRVASALGLPFEVVLCDPAAGTEIAWRKAGEEPPEFLRGEKIRWGRVRLASALEQVVQHVRTSKVNYVLTGKRNRGGESKTNPERQLARGLFQEVPCTMIVMRLPEKRSITVGDILIPTGGGPHSQVALEIAGKLAGDHPTALCVQPDIDEFSRAVGKKHLRELVKRAKVDPATITQKVVLGVKVAEEIRREAETGKYELILIGASDARTLRSKLFGTVPDRLLRGQEGLGVAVVRGPLPRDWRVKSVLGEILRLSIPQLERDERITLVHEIENKSRWSFDFAFLMLLATFIASLGLLADSAAVVIGAMLVAPLMMPLLGSGLAVVQGNWPLWLRSSRAVLLGFFVALTVGWLAGLAAPILGRGFTSELAARGEPSLLDLGVAFAAGVAASYCLARPRLMGALAGVAIAAALVPPIATVGICLALGFRDTAGGASILFGTNVAAIVLGSATNFYAAGIRGRKAGKGRWFRPVVVAVTLVCLIGLVGGMAGFPSRTGLSNDVKSRLADIAKSEGYRLRSVRASGEEAMLVVIELDGPVPPPQDLLERLKAMVERRGGSREGLQIEVRTE